MRAYKIIYIKKENNNSGKLTSAFIQGWFEVTYSPGKWIKAKKKMRKYGYHLLVFKTFQNAIEFLKSIVGPYEIWECKIKLADMIMPPLDEITENNIRIMFQKRQEFHSQNAEQLGWPKGTLMAKKVKLIRRVWHKDKEVCND